ncbi:MAG: serine/threonine-protein phosphatase [Gracilibacteraceae bacterium]|jgi:hypothetical protein|nr:serine/threonine-protein phosphatase [Gracilibacteraceae bacterium]
MNSKTVMNFFQDYLSQEAKTGQSVCGDVCACERTAAGTYFILCDGIGSGVYANIAAITCLSRIKELLRRGVTARRTSETVADSMHLARREDIPFSAFIITAILPDGHFTVYTYEAPGAVLLRAAGAVLLPPRVCAAGAETIGEAAGRLRLGEALLLFSDGVTQAGMGRGWGTGIGAEGAASYISRVCKRGFDPRELPEKIVAMCRGLDQERCEDDTTCALLHCREARELTMLTGPPSRPGLDRDCAAAFWAAPGQKVICGSTTAEIVARESGRRIDVLRAGSSFASPPEYSVAGVDLAAEGAVTLNQVYNIIDEPEEALGEDSVVERFCLMLNRADVIHLMIGKAVNDAHEEILFKQIGVRARQTAVALIAEKLRAKGKLVTEKYW